MKTLTQEQKDLIFGTLLGDGNLQTENEGRTWRYRAIQASKHKDYLYHKYNILKSLCDSPPMYGETSDTRTQEIQKRYYFNTIQQNSLRFYGGMFYTYNLSLQKWQKDVPLNVGLFLTPQALAYLYMDDGSLKWAEHSYALRICTENFSHDGTRRLQKAF